MNPKTLCFHWCRILGAFLLAVALLVPGALLAIFEAGISLGGLFPLTLLALFPLGLAAWAFARFVHALYQVDYQKAFTFLSYRLFGRPWIRPYLTIENGKIIAGEVLAQKIGGPGQVVLKQDSAIVLEQSGRLTRVVKGPKHIKLEPFEKIWAMVDLHAHHWNFKVNAITMDGIPVAYNVALKFRIGHVPDDFSESYRNEIPSAGNLAPFEIEVSEDDVFKAALNTWIRDPWRSEPDRLMIWTKRVVIGATEGTMRAILARYKLDDLLDVESRREIREDLVRRLIPSLEKSGVVLLEVSLHDIEFKEKETLQLWASRWRARRDLEVKKAEAEGLADQALIRERARNEVRRELFEETLRTLEQYREPDKDAFAHYAVLSFAETLRRITPDVFQHPGTLEILERLVGPVTFE